MHMGGREGWREGRKGTVLSRHLGTIVYLKAPQMQAILFSKSEIHNQWQESIWDSPSRTLQKSVDSHDTTLNLMQIYRFSQFC